MAEGIFKKFERASIVLKLLVAGGGLYLLYRRFAKEKIPLPIVGVVPGGATEPLVAPSAQELPYAGANEVAYQGASPDQMNTTRQLATPGTEPLDPSALVAAALATGGKEVLTKQGMEDRKASDVALKAGDIFQAFLPSKSA